MLDMLVVVTMNRTMQALIIQGWHSSDVKTDTQVLNCVAPYLVF